MLVLVGFAVVIVSILGAFVAFLGVNPVKLLQPAEYLIILGSGAGAFIISNPKHVLGRVIPGMVEMVRGQKHTQDDYLELLSLLYQTFKLAKAKGMLALEGHVEHPDDSNLFQQFPSFSRDKHALTFLCDYLRLLTLGTDNPHEVESLLDEEIHTHHEERTQLSTAIQLLGDAMPALGIVAAVSGVIKTMGLIDQDVEIIGEAIGAALVGTFLGVLFGYAVFGPMATALKGVYDAETKYYQCIKAGLLAYMQGYAPAVCVEFARKSLPPNVRPSFYEVEDAVNQLPPV